ncbi:hypothetical protein DZK27_09640 [Rhodobacteraceae bacterium 63075]|nr:hypothetical protein DZK27_09640 [Rhodobacteraceae bacterium 63075]
MNKYGFGVFIAAFGALVVAAMMGLKYSQATVLFGLIAAISAPVVIHRVPDRTWSIIMLVALAAFASHPLKKLFQIEGFAGEIPVTLAYCGILWVIGFGWKRSWQ